MSLCFEKIIRQLVVETPPGECRSARSQLFFGFRFGTRPEERENLATVFASTSVTLCL